MAARQLIHRLNPSNSALFVCDIQEKFSKTVSFFPQIVEVSRRLIGAANELQIPVLATEQYPKGLGPLVPELGIDREKVPIFPKKCFSMILPEVKQHLEQWKCEHVILCGIEAHACIYQTTLDLLEQQIYVTVVADAVSSRTQTDRLYALKQLERAGAYISTSECVILSLLKGADHPKFKQVQGFIMEKTPDTELVGAAKM